MERTTDTLPDVLEGEARDRTALARVDGPFSNANFGHFSKAAVGLVAQLCRLGVGLAVRLLTLEVVLVERLETFLSLMKDRHRVEAAHVRGKLQNRLRVRLFEDAVGGGRAGLVVATDHVKEGVLRELLLHHLRLLLVRELLLKASLAVSRHIHRTEFLLEAELLVYLLRLSERLAALLGFEGPLASLVVPLL